MAFAGLSYRATGSIQGGRPPQELRLVLVGKTGAGKSATGNTILGEERFKSELCMSSVTGVCEKAQGSVLGRRLTLVDTPGLFDTSLSQKAVQEEIVRCLTMSSPGPHAILLVLQIGRFTEEEQRSVDLIQTIFHSNAAQYTILIFTHTDKLEGASFKDFISKQDRRIQDLLERFERRILPFNNKDSEDHSQVANLLKMIDHMLAQREKPYFTNQPRQNMDKALADFQEKLLEVKQEQIEKEKKLAIAKWEAIWTDFSTQMRDKKQEAELMKRHIKQNIKILSVKMAEVGQEVQVETGKLKHLEQLENTRKQRKTEYRKKIESEIRREEKEIDDRYSECARQETGGSSNFLRNVLIILGGAALIAFGAIIAAGVILMTAAPPMAAAAATGSGGLTGAAAAVATMATEVGLAAADMAANMAALLASQCSIQ